MVSARKALQSKVQLEPCDFDVKFPASAQRLEAFVFSTWPKEGLAQPQTFRVLTEAGCRQR